MTALALDDMFDGTIASVAPEAPDTTYSHDTGDDTSDKVLARQSALCNAVNRFVRTIFENTADAVRKSGATMATVGGAILGLWGVVPGLIYAGVVGLAAEVLAAGLDDEGAIQDVVCCMYGHLKDLPITRDSFVSAPGDCGFTFPHNNAQLAGVLHQQIQVRANWLAFLRLLGEEFRVELSRGGKAVDCLCPGTCDDVYDFENDGRRGWFMYPGMQYGHWQSGVGWESDPDGDGNYRMALSTFCEDIAPLYKIRVEFTYDGPNIGNCLWLVSYDIEGELMGESAWSCTGGSEREERTGYFGGAAPYHISLQVRTSPTQIKHQVHIHLVELVAE